MHSAPHVLSNWLSLSDWFSHSLIMDFLAFCDISWLWYRYLYQWFNSPTKKLVWKVSRIPIQYFQFNSTRCSRVGSFLLHLLVTPLWGVSGKQPWPFSSVLWLIPILLIKKNMSGKEPRAQGLPYSRQIPAEELRQKTVFSFACPKGLNQYLLNRNDSLLLS